ncbi:universal stress protein [Denitrobaculum tricleocarpae]|uniref:Universal stress protein n=1 Tax=Denitrobaculum tricleocarpae TaxID=2591009 RepID=A0A545TFW1_9PROT|nr:universal stress protein [Denitrobaculum tricleocarpae]TQV76117.1 universal stress protein [Denitrobaculum tricleocarpae]
MKKIVMATDLSARSDRALDRAVMLACDHGAELTVVHVIDEGLPASFADAQRDTAMGIIREQIHRILLDSGLNIAIEIVFGRAYVDILEVSERLEADLLVLGVHREDAFKDMFRGTTAERVIRAGNTPILLVKDRVNAAYDKIIVGVDFSVYSRRAIEFAVQFSPESAFHLVHAYDIPFKGFLYGPDTGREVTKQHQIEFEAMIDQEMATFVASLDSKAPTLHYAMQEGTVREVIDREVQRLKPGLLVIGTHGRTGVAHALLGSVAEDLLRTPPCDVLAVKAW